MCKKLTRWRNNDRDIKEFYVFPECNRLLLDTGTSRWSIDEEGREGGERSDNRPKDRNYEQESSLYYRIEGQINLLAWGRVDMGG